MEQNEVLEIVDNFHAFDFDNQIFLTTRPVRPLHLDTPVRGDYTDLSYLT